MLLRASFVSLLIALSWHCPARADSIDDWHKQIAVRLNANRRLPPEARGQSGTVKVGFVIDRAGNLVSIWLAENTGIQALDETALAIVEHAQPFPMPPEGLDEDQLRLTVPFVFLSRPPWSGESLWEDTAVKAKMRSICRGC